MNETSTYGGGFADPFLFWVSVAVVALTFTDFMLGKDNRLHIKERVGEWWLYVEDTSFVGFLTRDAGRIRQFIERLVGTKWLRPRFIIVTSILSVFLTFVLPLGVFLSFGFTFSSIEVLFTLLLLTVLNALCGCLSLAFTLFLLKKMEKSVSTKSLLGLILIDLIAIYLLGN